MEPVDRQKSQEVSAATPTRTRTRKVKNVSSPSYPGIRYPQHAALQKIIAEGSEIGRAAIDRYAAWLSRNGVACDVEDAMTLLDIAHYYENIADARSGLSTALFGFHVAESKLDVNLLRRANNTLGVAYSRSYDFVKASFHLREAARLALYQGSFVYELAALSNLVSLLEVMGLKKDADEVCTLLLNDSSPRNCKSSGPILQNIRLQNVINGASIALGLGNLVKARAYINIGSGFSTLKSTPTHFRALFAGIQAKVQAAEGDPLGAACGISRAIESLYFTGSRRTRVALAAAEAHVGSYACDDATFIRCCGRLFSLLEGTGQSPMHTEVILRALIKLHSSRSDATSLKAGQGFLKKLTQHLITSKHRQFYEQIGSPEAAPVKAEGRLHAPTYPTLNVPSRFSGVECYFSRVKGLVTDLAEECVDQSLFANGSVRQAESVFRTGAYCVAENWAIAADFKAGGSGRHGVWVGSIARIIALSLNRSCEESVQLDLACRLHDVGKLVINLAFLTETSSGRIDEFFVIREHSIAGAVILTGHGDPTLDLGANVARFHHEWWNGFGGPTRLTGPEIPQEARICAVADTCVKVLMSTASRNEYLSIPILASQLRAMSGIQLDPSIVRVTIAGVFETSEFRGVYEDLVRETNTSASLSGSLVTGV